MGTIEEPKDGAAVFVGKTVREVFNAAVPVAEAAIIAAEPWMAAPVWEQIWEEIFSLSVKELGGALGDAASFVVMDFQKYVQVMSVARATQTLKAAQSTGDPDAIAKAKVQADAAADALLTYGGDAHA